jgi:hypothetical protein
MAEVVCPLCHSATHLVYHATYHKYYYEEQIPIIRVTCTECEITHAIIPSFSLSGTSIGTREAEDYLEERARGASRTKAGRCFFRTWDERTVSGIFRKDDVAVRSKHESPAPTRRKSVPGRLGVSFEPERIITPQERIRFDRLREQNLSHKRTKRRIL